MTVREFAYWIAYYRINPWGDHRADLRSGIVAATVANCHGKKRYKPADFIPKFEPPKSVSQMELLFRQFANMHNASLKAKKNGNNRKP